MIIVLYFKKDFLENRDWCAAIIKDFEGDVYFRIDEDKFIYEDKECFDYEVKVVIDGVNKKPVNPFTLYLHKQVCKIKKSE